MLDSFGWSVTGGGGRIEGAGGEGGRGGREAHLREHVDHHRQGVERRSGKPAPRNHPLDPKQHNTPMQTSPQFHWLSGAGTRRTDRSSRTPSSRASLGTPCEALPLGATRRILLAGVRWWPGLDPTPCAERQNAVLCGAKRAPRDRCTHGATVGVTLNLLSIPPPPPFSARAVSPDPCRGGETARRLRCAEQQGPRCSETNAPTVTCPTMRAQKKHCLGNETNGDTSKW